MTKAQNSADSNEIEWIFIRPSEPIREVSESCSGWCEHFSAEMDPATIGLRNCWRLLWRIIEIPTLALSASRVALLRSNRSLFDYPPERPTQLNGSLEYSARALFLFAWLRCQRLTFSNCTLSSIASLSGESFSKLFSRTSESAGCLQRVFKIKAFKITNLPDKKGWQSKAHSWINRFKSLQISSSGLHRTLTDHKSRSPTAGPRVTILPAQLPRLMNFRLWLMNYES